MLKYFLTALYLLIMLAILKSPVNLPNEGLSKPTWEPEAPKTPEKEYAAETSTQKTAIYLKKEF